MRLLVLLYLSFVTALFGGYDHSIDARVDGWNIEIDTAGLGEGEEHRVVTRVFLRRNKDGHEAQMELPGGALYLLWEHLDRLPKTKSSSEILSIPPASDGVLLTSDRFHLIEPDKALPLLRLWLDSNLEHWKSKDDLDFQEKLRTEFFPPKTIESKK